MADYPCLTSSYSALYIVAEPHLRLLPSYTPAALVHDPAPALTIAVGALGPQPRFKMRADEVGDGYLSWVVATAPDPAGDHAPAPIEPGTAAVSADLEDL